MPHSTRTPSQTPVPSFKFPDPRTNSRSSMEKFPDHVEFMDGQSPYPVSPEKSNGYMNGTASADRWQPRRDSATRGMPWNGQASTGGKYGGHNRQKSLGDAFRTIRTRKGSVSANVHEVADALKAPVSPKLIVCSPSTIFNGKADGCRFYV